jgi:hypothetical protein
MRALHRNEAHRRAAGASAVFLTAVDGIAPGPYKRRSLSPFLVSFTYGEYEICKESRPPGRAPNRY